MLCRVKHIIAVIVALSFVSCAPTKPPIPSTQKDPVVPGTPTREPGDVAGPCKFNDLTACRRHADDRLKGRLEGCQTLSVPLDKLRCMNDAAAQYGFETGLCQQYGCGGDMECTQENVCRPVRHRPDHAARPRPTL